MTQESTVSNDVVTTLLLKRVAGDGSCAFRAIAQGRALGTLSAQEEAQQARELRELAVRLLRQRGEEEMVGTGMTIRQVVLMKESYSSYESYCAAMARNDYAGETEFWLLSEELDIRIAIFINTDTGLDHLITYGTGGQPPVCLLWQRGASEAGNHYDSLIPQPSR